MLFKKDELRILWPFYLSTFVLTTLHVTVAYYYIYLASLGFSFTQISIIFAVQSVIIFLMEVPTGAIADIFGAKKCVLFGSALLLIFNLLIPFFNSFIAILILFMIEALALTFISGADEAWVVDVIKSKGKNLVDTYFAKEESLINAGFVIAPLLAGLVVEFYAMSNLFFVRAFSYIAYIGILLFAFNPHVHRFRQEISLTQTVIQSKKAIRYSYKHPKLFLILLAGLFIAFATEFKIFGHSLYLQEVGINLAWIGYAGSVIAFFGIFLPYASAFLNKWIKKSYSLALLILLQSIVLISIIAIFNKYWILLTFVLFALIGQVQSPIRRALINQFIISGQRATILSLQSMINQIPSFIGVLLAGIIADYFGLKILLVLAGIIFIPTIFLYLKIKK